MVHWNVRPGGRIGGLPLFGGRTSGSGRQGSDSGSFRADGLRYDYECGVGADSGTAQVSYFIFVILIGFIKCSDY